MGNFQAVSTATDGWVKFTGTTIEATGAAKQPTVVQYYTSIIKTALTMFQISEEILPPEKPTKNNDDDHFEINYVQALWGSIPHPIGFILQDTHLSKDQNSLLNRIADEEKKYYWKWLEDSEEVKDAEDGSIVLNQLRIVNVRIFNRLITESTNAIKLWNDHETLFQNSLLKIPPILISERPSFSLGEKHYYAVYLNNDSRLLFLDESGKTERYKYGETGSSGFYKRERTYKYHAGTTNEYKDRHTILVYELKQLYDDFLGEKHKEIRYLYFLREHVTKLSKKTKNPNHVKNVPTQAIGTEEEILGNIHFKKGATNDKGEPIEVDDDDRNNTEKDAVNNFAESDACELPSGYRCFYYSDGETLKGHISGVNIGEGGRGGAGYHMRADRVDEINYHWSFDADADHSLATLWSYLFELKPDRFLAADPPVRKNKGTNAPGAFYPTNWPYDKVRDFKTEVTGMKSLIHYYKTFKNKTEVPKKRNKPVEDPFPPRVTNPDIHGYDYKFAVKETGQSVKLDNKSYRVWKKVNSSTREELTLGISAGERQDAGKTMAEALKDFHIYGGMKDADITPKITDSKLSATAFAKYIVGHDEDVKEQWRKDNFMPPLTDLDASSLKTDQEWCHLFGHGDGGPEELGNFVSGSKHCNTEQLAIETGQRRVSQNEKDFGEKRKKIKARITAYLLPNQGTWVEGTCVAKKPFDKNFKEKYLLGDGSNKNVIEDNDVKDKLNNFIKEIPGKPGEFCLKDPHLLHNAFKDLSDAYNAIKKPDSDADKKRKKELFLLRRNIEKHFFMYLPIARWMRYKLYYDGKKVFDHIYDAQSESVSLHECQILDYTVERVLYQATEEWEKYKTEISRRIKDLVPVPIEVDIAQSLLELDQRVRNVFNSLMQIKVGTEGLLRELDTTPEDINIENVDRIFEYFDKQIKFFKKEIIKIESSTTRIANEIQKNLPQQPGDLSKLNNIFNTQYLKIKSLMKEFNEISKYHDVIGKKIPEIKRQLAMDPRDQDKHQITEDINTAAEAASIFVGRIRKLEEAYEDTLPEDDKEVFKRRKIIAEANENFQNMVIDPSTLNENQE